MKKYLFIIHLFASLNICSYSDPDFIIIGAQKSGTTSLYNYLIQHPKILPASRKEIHFFDNHYSEGIDWYRTQFPNKNNPEFITGEATPSLIFFPGMAQRVNKWYPNIKLILLLRNPVNRAFSHYKMNVAKARESESFEKAIDLEDTRISSYLAIFQPDGITVTALEALRDQSYIARGKYAEQLLDWLQYFDKDQILVLFFEEFIQDPEFFTNKVFNFLGLDTYSLIKYNNFYSSTLPDMSMSEETRKRLALYFKSYNKELEALLGRKVPW